MSFGRRLDELPQTVRTPKEKFLEALSMYDEGVAMQRLVLQRQHPAASDAEIDALLHRWLAREDEAVGTR